MLGLMSDRMCVGAPQKQINNWFYNARKRYPRKQSHTVNEQAAADVSSPFTGTKDTGGRVPITNAYYKAGLCPVNVHGHLGSEHRSNGQYDENGKGPADSPT